uniref:Uncharacterized protein n=1 Tax=Globisporangium ultimum (strain ATCC 200006 / CBS 805.95 / DAOM BR144) TaxID=431595 RepID=K3WN27_GLOUD
MLSAKTLVATLTTFSAMAMISSAQTFVYEFDPQWAGGVKGAIKVNYPSPSDCPTKADISANLDFSQVDVAALKKIDGNCTTEPTAYKWHIHVKWNSTKTSDSLAQCSKVATSNHYDPLLACGPNSEFAETPAYRVVRVLARHYSANPAVCEKGDLSGKIGDFKLDTHKQVSGQWTDDHYPLVSENTPQWNIILHAVCDNKATPRLACALGKRTDDYGYGSDGKTPAYTPAATTPAPAVATPAPTYSHKGWKVK